ncbi:UrcA family protein [Sphingomonas naasensis]|uniref:UrcA family protein n=1 Tax=Sphingomonas naasensis TaxID=1344951 RepID=A0A4S1WJH9_9SPHN|nr:UrcA family protein [Sphingomonas naasensis]NIJ21804.1 UrcA family protein [Sphingomonas naasensis]TGX42495.1 UrcA family protein [Sphingomonas naasensis]
MRTLIFLPFALLGACASGASAQPLEPTARLAYGDLALDDAAGRAELRGRVATAARGFCRQHEDDVTPQLLQSDRFYCFEQVRSTLVADMPRAVRNAYRQALREAGVSGRRL